MHEIHIKVNSIAKKKPIQSQNLAGEDLLNLKTGLIVLATEIKEAENNHWRVKMPFKPGFWYLYKPHCKIIWEQLIDFDKFTQAFPYARKTDLDIFFEPLNQALAEFEINTSIRMAAFLAQIAHESGSLRYREEIASGSAYEGRKDLGNLKPGDGVKYKGRGLIQLTGRHNYHWASTELNLDLVENPDLATQALTSARIAGLYWHSRGLNKRADFNTLESFKNITRAINGGLNGWNDRVNHWYRIKKVLGC